MLFSPKGAQRLTQLLLALLAAGVWGLLLKPYLPLEPARASTTSGPWSTTLDTLNVQRINVVDPDGKTRLIISDSAHFPGAIIHGNTYPRSIHNVAGVIFLDTRGHETGGLAFAKLRDDDIDNLSFDYTFQPTDGIRMWKQESPDGKRWRTAFEIFDRRPYQPGPPTSSQGIERIALSDRNEDASLVISDAQGHPRIRIGVDRAGKPEIEMLDTEGRVIYRAGASPPRAR
jgi:hypothetical protein